jgi:hypothetical protein
MRKRKSGKKRRSMRKSMRMSSRNSRQHNNNRKNRALQMLLTRNRKTINLKMTFLIRSSARTSSPKPLEELLHLPK